MSVRRLFIYFWTEYFGAFLLAIHMQWHHCTAFSVHWTLLSFLHVRIRAGLVCLNLSCQRFWTLKHQTWGAGSSASFMGPQGSAFYTASWLTSRCHGDRKPLFSPLLAETFSVRSVPLPFEDDFKWWGKAACVPQGSAAGASPTCVSVVISH